MQLSLAGSYYHPSVGPPVAMCISWRVRVLTPRVVALEMSFLFGISSQPFITRAITESLCCRPNLRPILVACCPCDAHRLWSSATICGFFYVSLLKSFFSYRSIIDMFSFHKNLKMSSYMKFFIHILWKENVFDHRLNMNVII